jgi:rhodanese-related sulfurtransferase
VKHSPRFLRLVEEVRPRVKEATVEEVRSLAERGVKFFLIDVREESEYAAGRIPGAIHIGRGILERDIEVRVPDPGAGIVLYCGGGYRSALSADNLGRMGYTNVSSMAGGWRRWNELGYPTEEG